MNTEPAIRSPKFLENSLLVAAGLMAHAPLWYQLPRWAQGLDPTFVHPLWVKRSPLPLFYYLAELHPLVWMTVMVIVFIRLCRNYGWRLEK